MERWRGRVAVVTGASAGIGAAIAYQFQDAGLTVVALARRKEKIPEAVNAARTAAEKRNRSQIGKAPSPGKLHCLKCDVTKEEDVIATFKWIRENTKGVDILVNNAGVAGKTKLSGPESNTEQWRSILNINVLGLSLCTREAVQVMRERGVDDGHIVHICSMAGHHAPPPEALGWGMYYASKHAVRVLTEGLRKELVAAKSRIRVTEVSPGLVHTSIFDPLDINQKLLWNSPHLNPEDVADSVLYAIASPAHVQIHEIIMGSTTKQL
ncbi:hypothetical protein R5R35_009514 [Gryllus longicercus]|uniref:Dehydrogenase/reductase SDR family member 11 n=1 Tax=Gryllus longicercus TaxID=2509291 RepID=A0AAN9VJD6_9ORTH